ncbi:beta-ketoacyl-[acyl-carrier-protein] synthase family protein [Marinigracilibium pacificum]|uniref:3-oxoacyl-[acyl-carrier-protein] synthase 1 n=1 Tax=Marinigracilibium pacificum TaxID=2729599 RepID=A0A848IZZ4_9BACT|nr:beta-ketoacyl-[acyl-carrier-protein] synthase family protein [Marinigracilibium pacificum]NMM47870.1 beta-ketoacyl-[acyl-carrier-protein] synthase family protein [Marinigracilibium pacificum]
MDHRVVITGIGIYSTLGVNLEEVKDSLYNGRSGIGIDQERLDMGFRSPLTGVIQTPDLKPFLKRRERIGLPDQGQYAYMATREALFNAQMDEEFLKNNIVGIIYGNDSSAKPVIEASDIIREKKDTTLIGSGSIFQSMNSTVTMNLSTILKLKGINMTISAACASGSHSIGLGYMMIKHGYQDKVICGGAQEINAQSMGSFDGLSTFSTRIDDPAAASRPFDIDRDGLVPSGGAATVIIESLESAQKRGATIYGEILGYGFSSDGDHISRPNQEGPTRSLENAFKQANINPEEIDYINAHATSTPIGDLNEAKAIDNIFGNAKPFISSTKSMTGHEMWMAGASEIIYSLLMMNNNFIASNLNLKTPNDEVKHLNFVKERVDTDFNTFLSNSFGFGGTNSSIIIRKF